MASFRVIFLSSRRVESSSLSVTLVCADCSLIKVELPDPEPKNKENRTNAKSARPIRNTMFLYLFIDLSIFKII